MGMGHGGSQIIMIFTAPKVSFSDLFIEHGTWTMFHGIKGKKNRYEIINHSREL